MTPSGIETVSFRLGAQRPHPPRQRVPPPPPSSPRCGTCPNARYCLMFLMYRQSDLTFAFRTLQERRLEFARDGVVHLRAECRSVERPELDKSSLSPYLLCFQISCYRR